MLSYNANFNLILPKNLDFNLDSHTGGCLLFRLVVISFNYFDLPGYFEVAKLKLQKLCKYGIAILPCSYGSVVSGDFQLGYEIKD